MTDTWHRGDWMQTFTGRRFYPLDPRPEDIDPLDIAHSLALQCRYNGHVDRFYSVAEHCLLISSRMPTDQLVLEALLHDAAEAYVGDMVRPLKHSGAVDEYKVIEAAVELAIARRFDLPIQQVWFEGVPEDRYVLPSEVKDADTRILLTERTALMSHYKPSDRWSMDGMEALDVKIHAWDARTAEVEYIIRLADFGIEVTQ